MSDNVTLDTLGIVIVQIFDSSHTSSSSLWPIAIAVIVCAVIIGVMTGIIIRAYNCRHERELKVFQEYRNKNPESSNN